MTPFGKAQLLLLASSLQFDGANAAWSRGTAATTTSSSAHQFGLSHIMTTSARGTGRTDAGRRTALKAASSDDDDDEDSSQQQQQQELRSYRASLEKAYALDYDSMDLVRFDFTDDNGDDDFNLVSSVIEFGGRAAKGGDSATALASCAGDDCDYGSDDDEDDCPIPESFKRAASSLDVLAFLGIQRAQPLAVPPTARRQREWE